MDTRKKKKNGSWRHAEKKKNREKEGKRFPDGSLRGAGLSVLKLKLKGAL